MSEYNYSQLASVGINCYISNGVYIKRPHLINIGNNVAIDFGFYITTKCDIKNYVHIGPYVTAIGGSESFIEIMDFVSISTGCKLIAGSDSFSGQGFTTTTVPKKYRDNVVFSKIRMEMFSALASNVVVSPGITIAEGSVVGACSFVNKDTEPWTFYHGVPARAYKKRSKSKLIAYARELGYSI